MSKKQIEKRRVWQEKVYQKLKEIKSKRKIRVLGKKFLVLPRIFAPTFPDPILLAKAVKKETKKEDFVLDLGTGTGIQGIFAAEKASKIIATDINPLALKCAKFNIKKHKLNKKIKVLRSDLFDKIKDKFDLIIFNPPFRWFKPRDMLEKGELDENYATLRKFFSEVKNHLKKNGRILLVFSNSGDIKYLERLIKLNRFKAKTLLKQRKNNWKYFIYRLTV